MSTIVRQLAFSRGSLVLTFRQWSRGNYTAMLAPRKLPNNFIAFANGNTVYLDDAGQPVRVWIDSASFDLRPTEVARMRAFLAGD